MEVDRGFEVFEIEEAPSAALDGHDLAVESLGPGVGDEVRAVGDHVLQSPLDHCRHPIGGLQALRVCKLCFNIALGHLSYLRKLCRSFPL